jgi:hypothetical protein
MPSDSDHYRILLGHRFKESVAENRLVVMNFSELAVAAQSVPNEQRTLISVKIVDNAD